MDLTTTYMGLTLKSPIVPSASPLSQTLDGIRRLEDAGAAAVVMHSLFEEEVTNERAVVDHYQEYGADSFGEAQSYFPDMTDIDVGPEDYLTLLNRAKEATGIPIIGSLNGISTGGWIEYADGIEQAGADALELNIYHLPIDPEQSSAEVEQGYLDILGAIKKRVSIPVAVKLNPFLSSLPNMAKRLTHAGADALVLFNRFYQPDFDLENLDVVPRLVLSNSQDLRLPLHWVAILYGRVMTDFAITTGIHNHLDLLKAIVAGANVAMMASELLQNGPGRIGEILEAAGAWMEDHEYESVQQMRGSMCHLHVDQPANFERTNYLKMLQSWRPDPTGRNP